VRIDSEPPGAVWYLDQTHQGRTPAKIAAVAAGDHWVRLELDGYETALYQVTVRPGQLTRLNEALAPDGAYLTIEVTPADARVQVMDVVAAYRPGMVLVPGRHRIRVTREGYGVFDEWRELAIAVQVIEVRLEHTNKPSTAGEAGRWTEPTSGLEFVDLPGGCFEMGSPDAEEGRRSDEKQHQVCIEQPFALATTEVTNGQYRQYKPEHDSGSYRR